MLTILFFATKPVRCQYEICGSSAVMVSRSATTFANATFAYFLRRSTPDVPAASVTPSFLCVAAIIRIISPITFSLASFVFAKRRYLRTVCAAALKSVAGPFREILEQSSGASARSSERRHEGGHQSHLVRVG